MGDWWEPARQRAIADLRREVAARHYLRGEKTIGSFLEDGWPGETAAEFARITAPDWVPKRKRRLVTMWKIVGYWSWRGTFGDPGEDPFCFACGWLPRCKPGTAKARWNSAAGLERSHLVDHWLGGLDGPQNLVPLCRRCNQAMPMFGPGEGAWAIKWVMDAGPLGPGFST